MSIFANLLILEEFKAAQDRSGRDIVAQQPPQDFARGPLLQFGGHDLPPFHRVYGPVARGLEAGVIDEILPIERPAHASPFVVGQRSRGEVSVLRREYQIGPQLTLGGIALITHEGQARHRFGPQIGNHRVQHRDPHVLPLPGSFAREKRRGDRLGRGQRSGVVGDDGAHHPRAPGVPVALDFRQTGQSLNHGIVGALARIRTALAKPAYRHIDDVAPDGAHGVFAEADALGGSGTEVVYQDLRRSDQLS